MANYLGWPIVTAKSCFGAALNMGIKPWPQVREPEPLDNYIEDDTIARWDKAQRWGPRTVVACHCNPVTGEIKEDLFRTSLKPWACVWVLLAGDLVLVTIEWKHGAQRITFVPVSGVAEKTEHHYPTLSARMMAAAVRECREETGLELAGIESLGPDEGICTNVRNLYAPYFPFVGKIQEPVVKRAPKPDRAERLGIVLFPLAEWFKLLTSPHLWDQHPEFVLEPQCLDITCRALVRAGRMAVT